MLSFSEIWPESLTEGLDSISNVCVLCQTMPYGWRQCKGSVGPAALWTIAPQLRPIISSRRSMQARKTKETSCNSIRKDYLYCGKAYSTENQIFSSLLASCDKLKKHTTITWFWLPLLQECWRVAQGLYVWWTQVSSQPCRWRKPFEQPLPRPAPRSPPDRGPQWPPGETPHVSSNLLNQTTHPVQKTTQSHGVRNCSSSIYFKGAQISWKVLFQLKVCTTLCL